MTWRDRFWSKVERGEAADDCWGWSAGVHSQGYGLLWVGRTRKAHRLSWEIHNGPIPAGACVLHRCDNPPCANPRHLFLGSQADNVQDMMDKDRGNKPRGESVGRSVLRETDVREMRRLRAREEVTFVALARTYGVTPVTAEYAVKGKTWRHVQ